LSSPHHVVAGAPTSVASEIKRDETVVFFPTAASLSNDGATWHVPVHGWIFEPEHDDLLRNSALAQLQQSLRLPFGEPATEHFRDVARWLLVDNERGKRIEIRIGEQTNLLPPSSPNGHFQGTIELPETTVRELARDRQLPFAAVTNPGDERSFAGTTHLIAPQGVSIVSDIDDTIKVSQVRNKLELLRNTFLREPRAVEGMAAAYMKWQEQGAQFHYVSSSPWQLYPLLSKFIEKEGFPEGTWDLLQFRVKDETFFNLFADPVQRKTRIIEGLLTRYPQRKVILVGDTGEKDPEVYGELARKYPNQIVQISLRNVTSEKKDSARIQAALAEVPENKWCLFSKALDAPCLQIGAGTSLK